MIYVIGMGVEGRDGLGRRAATILNRAGLIVAGSRHLEEFKESPAQKVAIKAPLEATAGAIEKFRAKKKEDVAIIATGDPLLFGIADFIIKRFGARSVTVLPGVSTVQSAFALIKESMNGVTMLSVHSAKEDIDSFAKKAIKFDKLVIFTSPENTPAVIAGAIVKLGGRYDMVYVVQSIGMKDENIIRGTLEKVRSIRKFSKLNLMILVRGNKAKKQGLEQKRFGLPDSAFAHSGGMITKEELRVIVLSKLNINEASVVWDIGAGSGSIAIEAARLAPYGRVYAFEKNAARVKDIEENKRCFNVQNLKIVKGVAPGCLKGIEQPDAIFVGGGGVDVVSILHSAAERLKKHGIIVVSAVTMETASIAFKFFSGRRFTRDLVMINMSKARPAGRLNILAAANPVFIITAKFIQ